MSVCHFTVVVAKVKLIFVMFLNNITISLFDSYAEHSPLCFLVIHALLEVGFVSAEVMLE